MEGSRSQVCPERTGKYECYEWRHAAARSRRHAQVYVLAAANRKMARLRLRAHVGLLWEVQREVLRASCLHGLYRPLAGIDD